ncbi:ribonuclease E inhibitor RraB [Schaalia sp. 19OD2882]|uniref:ribonuclease E inhibitor RraB n=1 Tax=Schaalia sp. 19OD2882 TaxID=2794089 RepID=UPI001C1EACC0|nr:ribonuclease E inhibitor RraB [Schaalia sp. 19OD2882]QWW20083.1 ribonuclease E inhibitor RraB [Schaalia sp. 19OD2882]
MDDRLLEILESQAGADLSLARDWIHYSYFPDETSARAALAECEAAGWTCVNDVWQTDDGAWSVSVARLDTPVNHSTVPKARVFFEELTERLGGEYDGWECAVEPSGK